MCEPGPRSENKKEFTRVETRSPQRENKLENSVRAVVGSSCNCLLPSVLFFCSLSTFLFSFPFFLFILVASPVLKSRAQLRAQLSVDQPEKLTRAAESCSVAKSKCFRFPIESLPKKMMMGLHFFTYRSAQTSDLKKINEKKGSWAQPCTGRAPGGDVG